MLSPSCCCLPPLAQKSGTRMRPPQPPRYEGWQQPPFISLGKGALGKAARLCPGATEGCSTSSRSLGHKGAAEGAAGGGGGGGGADNIWTHPRRSASPGAVSAGLGPFGAETPLLSSARVQGAEPARRSRVWSQVCPRQRAGAAFWVAPAKGAEAAGAEPVPVREGERWSQLLSCKALPGTRGWLKSPHMAFKEA